jgi:hypothetical protein
MTNFKQKEWSHLTSCFFFVVAVVVRSQYLKKKPQDMIDFDEVVIGLAPFYTGDIVTQYEGTPFSKAVGFMRGNH